MGEEEHDQNFITAIQLNKSDKWIDVVPGTMDMLFNEMGGVDFIVDRVVGGVIEGKLTNITGIRSFGGPEEEDGG